MYALADPFLQFHYAVLEPHGEYPRHDPETYETIVSGLFLASAVIVGRQSGSIVIENGRFHGEQVVQSVASRLADMRASVESA
jgi:thioredoxin reductase (NADPH)